MPLQARRRRRKGAFCDDHSSSTNRCAAESGSRLGLDYGGALRTAICVARFFCGAVSCVALCGLTLIRAYATHDKSVMRPRGRCPYQVTFLVKRAAYLQSGDARGLLLCVGRVPGAAHYQIPMIVLCLAATFVRCFASSHGFVKLFGVLALLTFTAAHLVHVMPLASIWCFFFAVILSHLIYLHLRFRQLGGFPRNERFRR